MASRRKFFTGVFDPIQDLIDKQLASLWIETIYTWKRGAKHMWGRMGSEDRSTINYVEDLMITALDKKYHTHNVLHDCVLELKLQGYVTAEVALLLHISERTVKRIIKQLKDEGETKNGENI